MDKVLFSSNREDWETPQKLYESISEASRKTGIAITSISYCANGKRKTGGGFIWHFV